MNGVLREKPIWNISEAIWVDYAPNPRFAIWGGTSPNSPASDAVFDKETGLVWERSPATNRTQLGGAIVYSTTRVVAGCKGWRLPALEELLSLVDPVASKPTLPTNHPFINVQLDYYYWSLTRGIPLPTDQNLVWGYNFGNADTGCIVVAVATCHTWLVRGGYGHNYILTI